jgi:hypothetical protein
MGYRKFTDSGGNEWEINDRYRSQWDFVPLSGNAGNPRSVRPPGYQKDVYELSQEELQQLLDSVSGPTRPRSPNPFGD